MANLEVLALDTAVPQIRAPGAGDGYSVPRDMTMASGTTLAAQAVTSTSLGTTGNLTFSGTGQRITGDFSNATISSRLLFQTSTANTNTTVGIIPNGTGNVSTISLEDNSSPGNNSFGQISIVGTSDYRINSGIRGTGTYLPMTFYTGGSERMRLDTSGNLGVGTASPATKFQVYGDTNAAVQARVTNINAGASAASLFTFGNNTDAYVGYVGCVSSAGVAANGVYLGSRIASPVVISTDNAERMRITSDGEVYIAGTTDQGAYNLQCNGTGVWGAGAYVNGSDARLKDNIQSLDAGLDVVKAMRPVTFQYKPDYSKDQSVQPGFIAQELQIAMAGKSYLEGVVQEGPNHLNVAYQNIIPILVKAIQELSAKVAALEAK